MRIDLHSHTTISDGIDTPEELIGLAKSVGISALAITDHDSVLGWMSLRDLSSSGELMVIPGAEISTRTESGMSVHILGYLFDPENEVLRKYMELTRDDRVPRIKRMIKLLNEADIPVTFDDVVSKSGSNSTIGRPHLADALIGLGIVTSREEAFAHYLHNESPFYVGHFAPTPEQAIAAIAESGGVSILAHGLAGSRGEVLTLDQIEELISCGLNGVEVYHRDHDQSARESLRELAERLDAFATGSSDYHGAQYGQMLGMEVTAPEVLESILEQGKGCEVFSL